MNEERVVGYYCPACEQVVPGHPATILEGTGIAFLCARCGVSWENTQDAVTYGIVKIRPKEGEG